MEIVNLNQDVLDKIKVIIYSYDGKIPESMGYYYKDILNGNNIDIYMQTYSLSKEDLIKYARVCKVAMIYKEIAELMDMLESETKELEKDDINEYQGYVQELQGEGEKVVNDINDSIQEEEPITYSNNSSILIYPSYIDESKQRTINSHSGREDQAQKSVANLIEKLNKADYQSLRKKGYIHQILQTDTKRPCYVGGNAFERIGHLTTKVNYIRVPISSNNREELKRVFNFDFDTIYLIVSYGDFKNEGYDEKRYYVAIYSDFQKHIDELMNIIEIFRNDFTPQTREVAIELVNNGFKMTEELTSIIKNQNTM